jgi:hypothetical protein
MNYRKHFHNMNTKSRELQKAHFHSMDTTLTQHEHQTSWSTENTLPHHEHQTSWTTENTLHKLQKTQFHAMNTILQPHKTHFHNMNTKRHELQKTFPQHEHHLSWTTENTSTTWSPNFINYRKHTSTSWIPNFNCRKHTSTAWTPSFTNSRKHSSMPWTPNFTTTENTLLQRKCWTPSATETHFHSINTKLCPLHCSVPMKGVVPVQFVCKLPMTTWHLEQWKNNRVCLTLQQLWTTQVNASVHVFQA